MDGPTFLTSETKKDAGESSPIPPDELIPERDNVGKSSRKPNLGDYDNWANWVD